MATDDMQYHLKRLLYPCKIHGLGEKQSVFYEKMTGSSM